jgi:4-alpha-glucanotransferase
METGQDPLSLQRASEYCGIQTEFWDTFGHHHVASPEAQRAIATSFGLCPDHLDKDIAARECARWSRIVDPCVVESSGKFTLHLPESHQNETLTIEITLEDGHVSNESVNLASLPATAETRIEGKRFVRKEYPAATHFPLGYHDLVFTVPGLPPAPVKLIHAPSRAYIPPFLENGGKTAGIAIALYGLRSARNWGCGDFRDLRDFCDWAATEIRVTFVALNPLHALHNRAPYNTSPYLPNSIFYQNLIYLDVEGIDEFRYSPEAQQLFHEAETQEELAALRDAKTVQYERVQAIKLRFLKLAFQHFLHNPSPTFRDYQHQEGDLLLRFATFCALDEYLHAQNPDLWIWSEWPAGYQDPVSPETLAFQKDHAEDIAFHQWVQWQLDRQLSDAQEHARAAGLPIGLYHDLALATDRFGSDLWAHRPFYVAGARVGSPPDDFSPQGQDWAFPPPNKYEHRASCYQLFIESIRKTCRHGGALRIDHVMRFFRLFWIPDGSTAMAGAYVRDFADDLIRILALESVRNRVLIVGEDLGTVEPHVRETLSRFGILSYRLFYFEREENRDYKPASVYPYQALVSSTTHDLPTIAGFWINQDIEARRQAGTIDEGGYHAQIAGRIRDKQKMLDLLFASHLLPAGTPRDAARIPELSGDLHNAIIGFLASTPSMLLVINQEDLSKETEQQNLPGTTSQYPNWSHKMKFTLEQLRSDPASTGFVEMLRHWLGRTGRIAPPAI